MTNFVGSFFKHNANISETFLFFPLCKSTENLIITIVLLVPDSKNDIDQNSRPDLKQKVSTRLPYKLISRK